MAVRAAAPVRRTRMLAPETVIRRAPNGTLYARSPHPLGPYPRRLTDRLDHWAEHAPDRHFLAERDGDGQWRTLSYRSAWCRARCIAQSLLDRGLSAERPIVILSGNSLEHALLALAAMYSGIPYAPIAPAYALLTRDYTTLRVLWATLRPGLVFASNGQEFSAALRDLASDDSEFVTLTPADGVATSPFAALEAAEATRAVDVAHARVGPSSIAKILFTSGSTGHPKGVINTQQMLCANQEQLRTALPFLGESPPVLCDWLPWNHTFGGNHNFGITLYNGGTLYLDGGKPTPGLFDTTVANLREIATSAYFNVPRGFEMLAPVLASDAVFCRHFFSRLQMLFYAAAGLRQDVADTFEMLAIGACGERIPWVTGLGATESAPFALCTGARMATTANVGVPAPGVELKVVPTGDTMEARLRGPNVTPGFWRNDVLTRSAYDEEGFLKLGDALGFADPYDPSQGFTFQGRLADDFKLSTGTWVRVGALRSALLALLGDVIDDAVIAGRDRDYVAALFFPNVDACRALCGAARDWTVRAVLEHPAVAALVLARLTAFAASHPGSSMAVRAAALLEESPSFDAGEITAKGSLNQKAVLAHRTPVVDQLYGAPGRAIVLRLTEGSAST